MGKIKRPPKSITVDLAGALGAEVRDGEREVAELLAHQPSLSVAPLGDRSASVVQKPAPEPTPEPVAAPASSPPAAFPRTVEQGRYLLASKGYLDERRRSLASRRLQHHMWLFSEEARYTVAQVCDMVNRSLQTWSSMDVHNMLRKRLLNCYPPETGRGNRRLFSRLHVFELLLLKRLSRFVELSAAKRVLASVMEEIQAGRLPEALILFSDGRVDVVPAESNQFAASFSLDDHAFVVLPVADIATDFEQIVRWSNA